MIRLLIVDDHALMREGLKRLFAKLDDIQVSAEAGSGEEALVILQNESVDVILLDLTIPGIHGAELIMKINELPNRAPILVLSMHNEPQIVKRKLKAGVSGYITKDSSPKDLLEAIRKVASGGRYIAGEIAEKIAFEVNSVEDFVPHVVVRRRMKAFKAGEAISLLIVDDHALVREGLKRLFDGVDDIGVGSEASSGEEALAILQDKRVDVILLDISIPGIHGVELIMKINELPNSAPILVLSMHNEPQIAKRKLVAGASGYITKDSSPKDLLEAIRKVAAGGRFIASEIAEKIAFEVSSVTAMVPHELLSGRELVILRMLAAGKKIHEIALELDISNKTVSTHKARLMQKMGLDGDVKLIQYATRHGMIQ